MNDKPGWRTGWSMPIIGGFDFASLARRLGQVETDACRARKQGRCPGKEFCSDCTWSEGPERPGH